MDYVQAWSVVSLALALAVLAALWLVRRRRRAQPAALVVYTNPFSFAAQGAIDFYAALNRARPHAQLTAVEIVDAVTGTVAFRADGLQVPLVAKACASYRDAGCDFPLTYTLPAGAVGPGLYKAAFHTDALRNPGWAWFGVQTALPAPAGRDVALVCPSMTWQAYNIAGGASFYHYQDDPRVVSWSRPYNTVERDKDSPSNIVAIPRLLAADGIAYRVLDDLDLHRRPELLDGVRVLALLYHNEYWTQEMRDHVEAFIARGGHVLVAGGNVCWWKVLLEGNDIVVDKQNLVYHPDVRRRIGNWHRKGVRDPGEKVFGLSITGAGYPLKRNYPRFEALPPGCPVSREAYERSGGMTVLDERHPLFAGTDLRNGDFFGETVSLVDIELDGIPLCEDGSPDFDAMPEAPRTLHPLAAAMVVRGGRFRHSIVMAEVPSRGGGVVLHLGSMGWPAALHGDDPTLKRIFRNAVQYLLGQLA